MDYAFVLLAMFIPYFPIRSIAIGLGSVIIWTATAQNWNTTSRLHTGPCAIDRFHSRGQHLCKFIGTKESVYIRKEFNSHRIGLGHQHGCRFIVLEHQHGRRDVMWKRSIVRERGLVHSVPVLIPECLPPSQWVQILAPTYLLPRRSEWVFTLHQSTSRKLSNIFLIDLSHAFFTKHAYGALTRRYW